MDTPLTTLHINIYTQALHIYRTNVNIHINIYVYIFSMCTAFDLVFAKRSSYC